jgi:hypothetical protein
LRANGQYFRCNRGRFSPGLENIDFVNQVGTPRSRREVLEKTEQVFNMVLGQATELLGESARDDGRHLPLQSFMSEQPLG